MNSSGPVKNLDHATELKSDTSNQYISCLLNGDPIKIQAGGMRDTDNFATKCHSLFIQQVTEDPKGLTKPLVDFGVELTCYNDFSEDQIPELVDDTLFIPKEFNDEKWWELDYETKRKSFYENHKPWPKNMWIYDGKREYPFPSYSSGFIKFDFIEKVEDKRYYCSGTFQFTYRFYGQKGVLKVRNGEFALIMNYE